MPPPKSRYDIIIADKPYEIDWPTYTFLDADPGFDARVPGCTHHSRGHCGPGGTPFAPAKGLSGNINRIRKRHIAKEERSLAAAQAIIKQMVVHLDGCASAEMCFNVLHNERGLSCHFLIDNDGTIYQTLDCIDVGYHAAGMNETSLGIEICNRGDAKKDPGYYDNAQGELKRDVVTCQINGHLYVAYDYTKRQYQAMDALGRFVARMLPGIKQHYPQKSSGDPSWETLYPGDEAIAATTLKASYSGFIGHYHITRRKWDPGPFDFKKYLTKQAGRRSFPMGLTANAKVRELPYAPGPKATADERSDYMRAFEPYYDNNETGPGGFFPVGPLDRHQLWHGGIHLHVPKGNNVYAPIEGKIVLARNGSPDPEIGSTSFVLIEHNTKIGTEILRFWTLLFHLAEEKGKKGELPKWMLSDGWEAAEPGKVYVLDPPHPVQGGDIIGHVGVAGPDGGSAQVHWEIFAIEHRPIENLDQGQFWVEYSGRKDQRYCTNKEILAKIETRKDGDITEEELLDHFHGDLEVREWTRKAVTSHYSEWSEKPDWIVALQDAPDQKRKRRRQREIEEIYNTQILPMIWWREDVAQKLGLPVAEARVYTYHPVSFLRWLNDRQGVKTVDAVKLATKDDYSKVTGTAALDIDDTDGESFVRADELVYVPPEKKLQLRDMVDGYGD